jgi:hypothetical protein
MLAFVLWIPCVARAQRSSTLYDFIAKDTATEQTALNGCVQIHHLWKREAASLHRTTGATAETRTNDFIDSVFRPYADFWSGYMGDEKTIRRMMSDASKFNVDDDPRSLIPTQIDVGKQIAQTLERMETFTGQRACGQWFLLYGPGVTNLGGLTGGRMLIDFFGLPRDRGLDDVRLTLPHELNHIVFGDHHRADPDGRTLLFRIINEGFATYVADQYWGDSLTTAAAHGYTPAQLDTAIAHEAELWAMARPLFASTDRGVISRWVATSAHVKPELPGKIGYFLGYQIVAGYVRAHGPGSWKQLYDMPVAQILRESGVAAAMRDPPSR